MSEIDHTALDRWIRRRDPEAFQTLAARHAFMIYATCCRVTGNPSEAEDAAQECLEVLAGLARAPRSGSLGAWLHGMASKLCLQRLRAEVLAVCSGHGARHTSSERRRPLLQDKACRGVCA